ncbi:MAG: cyclopropane-fatty-acyl-phospholipid synthase family protein [Gammaproteobacteria bacterium]|jgi:cyclopropane-fatty-acyl-phospholipid synthase
MKSKQSGYLNLPANDVKQTVNRSPSRLELWLLESLWRVLQKPPMQLKLWEGTAVGAQSDDVPRLVIKSPKMLWRFLLNPNINFGDGYSAGEIEVEGDLVRFMEAIFSSRPSLHDSNWFQRYALNRPRLVRRNTLGGSRDNIHHHYDLGNDFYRLWLDEEMLYTCAYFPDPEMSLEAAQVAKMEHVCRKLRLRPGEHVVEAGCGWGALSLYMAKHHGVQVKAFNVSQQQMQWARERAQREGLSEQVEFIVDDYRNVSGAFDVFVSIGMLEHVGRDNYAQMGQVIDRCLKRNGRGLVHSIGQLESRPMNGWIEKRIFPGAYPPTLSEIARMFEPWKLEVTDVENLRLHYAKTLEHWLARFESNIEPIAAMYDTSFTRAWRLYLVGSLAHFNIGALQLFQVAFNRATNNDIPWTRASLYRQE